MDACECDRVHAREALANTPPDVAQAVQWMAAGKRVMDREWLGGVLLDPLWNLSTAQEVADAIIAKLTENPRS
jgi:hypothetical protein